MRNSKFIKSLIGVVIISIIVLTGVWFLTKPKSVVLQGRIEAKEIYLSSKIPTRINSFEVKEGASVKKGQLIATLLSPEIMAKEQQALALRDAANAQKNKAQNGARSEEIRAAKSVYEKATAAANVMNKTYTRMANLFKDGVISEQKRDEIFAKKEVALKDQEAALSMYQMAKKGARNEDIDAATAMVKQADGALIELEGYKNERNIIAPIDAEVLDFLPEEGELIGAGYPVVHLVDLTNSYAILNIKETSLFNFKKESVFEATIPALNNKKVQFKIYYVAALGDYATWSATKATGDFDIRTFEIKAMPVEKEVELRPGMSILIDYSQFNE
ncbi:MULTISPECIES: HlyD family secretion protein [unclassified Polaribacter]|jgi:HlyD family secretion protein|uniref:HlyD family secretion protein n=1 Tax=unclassified Polaribacter TaxID=196858 RepID=UPI001C4F3979|nr:MULTISPECIES: efflux RND transporter periplasmic adaptor subunit [unclassified Polaribacter]QXP65039.1 efflux RND transporter periplasmic adaptor subunit [Polaribacter sp. HaHaR_3_91]QXP67533.1 efflux RND transporter periplasmic adaptor subunit [Polaribacter sp. AHE13PA]QXP69691.1 efflux RND transporter periplasmic adaptor subunit [Polaribacter sp. R2A056_3_33]